MRVSEAYLLEGPIEEVQLWCACKQPVIILSKKRGNISWQLAAPIAKIQRNQSLQNCGFPVHRDKRGARLVIPTGRDGPYRNYQCAKNTKRKPAEPLFSLLFTLFHSYSFVISLIAVSVSIREICGPFFSFSLPSRGGLCVKPAAKSPKFHFLP